MGCPSQGIRLRQASGPAKDGQFPKLRQFLYLPKNSASPFAIGPLIAYGTVVAVVAARAIS